MLLLFSNESLKFYVYVCVKSKLLLKKLETLCYKTENVQYMQPSERVPGACMMLVEMLHEAGCPPGVVNVIHGAHEAVDFICDHPDIRAISFVGSDQAVSII